jgi:hypothetical protein
VTGEGSGIGRCRGPSAGGRGWRTGAEERRRHKSDPNLGSADLHLPDFENMHDADSQIC